mgnify:CR=1 FL=1
MSPFVQDIKTTSSLMSGFIRSTTFSIIELGVAIKIKSALQTHSDKISDANIFFESFNSG